MATLTIEPPRPPRAIRGAAVAVAASILTKLMSMCLRQLASLWSRKGRPRTPPALFTRMSSRPNSSYARLTALRTCRGVEHICRHGHNSAPEAFDSSGGLGGTICIHLGDHNVCTMPR